MAHHGGVAQQETQGGRFQGYHGKAASDFTGQRALLGFLAERRSLDVDHADPAAGSVRWPIACPCAQHTGRLAQVPVERLMAILNQHDAGHPPKRAGRRECGSWSPSPVPLRGTTSVAANRNNSRTPGRAVVSVAPIPRAGVSGSVSWVIRR